MAGLCFLSVNAGLAQEPDLASTNAPAELTLEQFLLNRVNSMPVLTVGETEQFTQQGWIINFIKKEGKVRLEIDCDAARRTKLQLSSKLLSVADVVKGKP